MKLEEATALANKILEEISPFCERCEVAGSVRRRRPEVHDVDIVLIPRAFMWQSLINRLVQRGAVVVLQGSRLARLNIDGQQVDLYVASPDNWGTILLIRTGSAKHNIKLMNRARKMGLKFSAVRGVLRGNEVLAAKTEEEIFRVLNLEFKAPEEREE